MSVSKWRLNGPGRKELGRTLHERLLKFDNKYLHRDKLYKVSSYPLIENVDTVYLRVMDWYHFLSIAYTGMTTAFFFFHV